MVDSRAWTVVANYDATAKKGKLSADAVASRLSKITTATSFSDAKVAMADVVVEAAFERLDVKRSIFTQLDAVCNATRAHAPRCPRGIQRLPLTVCA